MGILNVTPDSFADGGLHFAIDRAVDHAGQLVDDGADILDIGGESTRPGADPVPGEEELRRVLPVVERVRALVDVPISIDTYKAQVAREAVALGATIVNDISNLQFDPELAAAVGESGAALILMHNRGHSREMYREAVYADVLAEVCSELAEGMQRAANGGVPRESVILDLGFGFAKRAEHSYRTLAGLERLASLNRPVLSGPSRKSFLQVPLGKREPTDRDWGTAAAVTASVLFGAHLVRVHNVRAMVDVVRVADQIRAAAELEGFSL